MQALNLELYFYRPVWNFVFGTSFRYHSTASIIPMLVIGLLISILTGKTFLNSNNVIRA